MIPVFAPTILMPGGASLDAATSAWVAAVVSNGGTVSAGRQTLVDDLIVGLKSDSVWTKLDRLWLHAAEDQPSALTDLVATGLATAVSSPSFSADDGFTFNGSSNCLNTNFNPATAGGNYALNSAHISIWMTVLGSGIGNPMGSFDGSAFVELFDGNPTLMLINDATGSGAGTGSTGLATVTRTASNARAYYVNGSSIISDAQASTGIPAGNIFVGARGDSGTPTAFSSAQVACSGIGGGFNATEALAFYNRLRTYMTAVGVP